MILYITESEAQQLIDKFVLVPLGDDKFTLELKPFPDGTRHTIPIEVLYQDDYKENKIDDDKKDK